MVLCWLVWMLCDVCMIVCWFVMMLYVWNSLRLCLCSDVLIFLDDFLLYLICMSVCVMWLI